MKKSTFAQSVFIVVGVLLLMLYGSAPLLLPRATAASAPADFFSAERAMSHVQTLAWTSRVVGSPEMEKTANYLLETLTGYGLNAEIQDAPSKMGTLHNVIARIPGVDSSRALLILTHPDSVVFGAGDNASGVAVLLEVARALQAGDPPQTDVILLFDDGEERGYWGGFAFAQAHPWMKDIKCAIGLDTAAWGPVALLQTTPGNSDLVRFYAGSVPNPVAFGFFADADWNLSHDSSEILPFYEQGIPGMALEDPTAFSGKHSADDTVEYVRPGSLQQMGDQTLAMARSFDATQFTQSPAPDLSFFTLWKIGIVHYPAVGNIVLLGLSTLGLVILIVFKIRRGVVSGRPLVFSTFIFILMIIAAGLAAIMSTALFKAIFPNTNPYIQSFLNFASLPFFLVELIVILLAFLFVRLKLAGKWGGSAVSLAGLLTWLLIGAAMLAALRTGSYALVIPFFAAVFVRLLPARWKFVTFIPAAIATVLLSPNVALAFLGTGIDMLTLVLVNILVVLTAELWVNE